MNTYGDMQGRWRLDAEMDKWIMNLEWINRLFALVNSEIFTIDSLQIRSLFSEHWARMCEFQFRNLPNNPVVSIELISYRYVCVCVY